MKAKKKTTEKRDTKEIMSEIINEALLAERKKKQTKEKEVISQESQNKAISENELPWWKKELSIDKFSIITYKNKLYGHYEDWGEKVYIGPYENEEELKSIFKDYVNRKIDTKKVHSIVLNIKNNNK